MDYDLEKIAKLRPLLETLAEQHGACVTQAIPSMLEILPMGCSKALGVAKLCEALGFNPSEELLALGDAEKCRHAENGGYWSSHGEWKRFGKGRGRRCLGRKQRQRSCRSRHGGLGRCISFHSVGKRRIVFNHCCIGVPWGRLAIRVGVLDCDFHVKSD